MYKYAVFPRDYGIDMKKFASPKELDGRVRELLSEAVQGQVDKALNDVEVLMGRKHSEEDDEDDEDTQTTYNAFQLFQGASEKLPRSLANLGIRYEMGISIFRNMDKARTAYEKAVRKNEDEVACNNLGLCLIEDKEYDRAGALLKRSADRNESAAYVNLRWLHEPGDGMEKKPEKAFDLYQRAARLGNAEGCFNLAVCYEKEIGTQYSGKLAEKYYEKAEELGNTLAKQRLKLYGEPVER